MRKRTDTAAAAKILATGLVLSSTILTTGILAANAPASDSGDPGDTAQPGSTETAPVSQVPESAAPGSTAGPDVSGDGAITETENAAAPGAPDPSASPQAVTIVVPESPAPAPATQKSK